MRTAVRLRVLLACALCLCAGIVAAQSDSSKKARGPEPYGRQLRFSADISRPVINLLQDNRRSYEFALDYYFKNELYFVAEGGFGRSDYRYPDLSYSTSNSFVRVGIDRTLIKRVGNRDWDMAFFGLRYAFAPISRSEASFNVVDSIWGNRSGTIAGGSAIAHWAELTGGIKVELVRNLMVGWNLRGRFLLNETSFRELRPAFIAGYGRGDRSLVFDFSVFVSYALRWGAKPDPVTTAAGAR